MSLKFINETEMYNLRLIYDSFLDFALYVLGGLIENKVTILKDILLTD